MRLTSISFALLALAASISAQESAAPDSSARGGSTLLQAMAAADSAATAPADSIPDYLLPQTGFLGWLDSWQRILSFAWTSDIASYSGSADFNTELDLLDGKMTSSWSRSETEHRQQDRSSEQSSFVSTWSGAMAEFASLDVTLTRNSLDDVTRIPRAGEARITNEVNNFNLAMEGGGALAEDFYFRWGAAGRASEDQATNRGNELASGLAGAAGSGRWVYQPKRFTKLIGKFSYDRMDGSRELRGREENAVTVRDTVGTHADLWLGKLTLAVDVDRISFVDERLDWRRNTVGQIDTTRVETSQQFGREREKRDIDRLVLSGDLQIFSNLDYHTDLRRASEERSFSFSREGFLQDNRTEWSNRLRLEYLPSAFLQLEYKFNDDWTDRRALDDDLFRGRETRRKNDLRFKLQQPILAASTIEINGQQYLEQLIYGSDQNNYDRDRFIERVDGSLSSEPFRDVAITVSGIMSREDEINIRAERVGNNREERLFELRGGYTWTPSQKFTFDQVYRQQIVFKDFHLSDDRDEFNKQGQFSTKLRYAPPATRQPTTALGGGQKAQTPSSPTIEFGHSVLFRQNGRRARPDLPFDDSYSTTLRRFDHTFTGSVSIPMSIWTVRVYGERGHLISEAGAGGRQTEEDGRLEMSLSGDKSFRLGLVSVSVDVRRVLAFGPRLRDDSRDYWMANSSATVRF